MKFANYILLFSVLTLLCSCNRDDDDDVPPDPIGKVFGQAMHHDEPIPNTTIYIKYGVMEFPGIDPLLYDDQVTATGPDATFEFNGLGKGNYYLFGVGFDEACPCDVIGGIPVVLHSDEATFETIVPITE
ncbi:MAG: hypothetical protein AB8F74_10875 [Saprospiraceae bacterium]